MSINSVDMSIVFEASVKGYCSLIIDQSSSGVDPAVGREGRKEIEGDPDRGTAEPAGGPGHYGYGEWMGTVVIDHWLYC